jgi:hypothetical protein
MSTCSNCCNWFNEENLNHNQWIPLRQRKKQSSKMRPQLLQHHGGIILHDPPKFLTCSRKNNSVWHWSISTWLMLQTQKNPHEWMKHQKCTSTLQQLDGGEDAVKESYVYSTWTIFEMIRVCVTSESDMIEWLLIHWKLFAFVSCLQLAVAWNRVSSLKSCIANPRNMGAPSRRSAAAMLCCNREGGPAACAGCGSPRNYKHRGNPQLIF